jgi:dephospho-CoA kinase
MPTKPAQEASFHSYNSEDGTVVRQLREWYKSPNDARRALDTLTKRASRIIKQGTKKDAKTGAVGKRVELLFSGGHKASPEVVIAWTDGSTLVRLSSTSLTLLLDFESQYYP